MSSPVGLYGHVRKNDVRSAALFGGFVFGFHLIAAVALFLPLAAFDETHTPIYGSVGYLLRYVPLVTLVGAALFLAQMFWHTRVVRKQVGFDYIGQLREPRLWRMLTPLAIAAGLPTPRVGVIETPALNAFACGIRRGDAVVVVTRGLLDELDDDELAAVIAHELVHIAKGDIRLLAAADVFRRNLVILQKQNILRVHNYKQAILVVAIPVFLPLILVAGFLTQVGFRVADWSRKLISFSREFVADAEAVRLTLNPAALVSALHRIEGRGAIGGNATDDAMMIVGASEGSNATHPTIAARIAAIVQVTGAMTSIAPARRDTRTDDLGASAVRRVRAFDTGFFITKAEKPTLFSVFAKPAGERNWVGLTRRDSLYMALAFCALMVFHRGELTSPTDLARIFDVRSASGLLRASSMMAQCNLSGLSQMAGLSRTSACDERVLVNAMSSYVQVGGRKFNGLAEGFYFLPGGRGFTNVAPPEVKAEQVKSGRCFVSEPYSVGDRGLHSVSDTSEPEMSLQRYLGFIAGSVRTINMPKMDRDKELKSYFDQRKLLLEISHRFFGLEGLNIARASYAGPEHASVIVALKNRMADQRFLERFNPQERAELDLLVASPSDFISCVARRAGV